MTVKRPNTKAGNPVTVAAVQQYSDLKLDKPFHPSNGDIGPVKGVDAIKNSLRNLLLTRNGERPFQPDIGAGLDTFLFDLYDDAISNTLIRDAILNTVNTHEPRVEIISVDSEFIAGRNLWQIDVVFRLRTTREEAELTLYLERLR